MSVELIITPTSGDDPLDITYSVGTVSMPGTPTYYEVDFGDGVGIVGDYTPVGGTYTYTGVDSYTAVLTVTDDLANEETDSVVITVNTPPPPTIVLTVNVNDIGVGGSINWSSSYGIFNINYGDGNTSNSGVTGASGSHTYTTAGVYTLTVSGTDAYGQSYSDSEIITVHAPPSITLSATPTSGVFPLSVNWSVTSNSANSITVDYGDSSGTTAYHGDTGSKNYGTVGTYTFTISVTDNYGQTSSDSEVITVTNPPLTFDLYVNPMLAINTGANMLGYPIYWYITNISNTVATNGVYAVLSAGGANYTGNDTYGVFMASWNAIGNYDLSVTITDTYGQSTTHAVTIQFKATEGIYFNLLNIKSNAARLSGKRI